MSAVPDVAGEVEAWRALLVYGGPRQPRLFSVTNVTGWIHRLWPADDWFYARCAKKHSSPQPKCACGIYALDTRERVEASGYAIVSPDELTVVAKVGLSGVVIPGECGFRAARGRVLELYVAYEHWRVAKTLGEVYGVPVELDVVDPAAKKTREAA